MDSARLLFPAIRWDAEHGFHRAWEGIERALQRGVGGFILFGGEAAAVADLTAELRRRAGHPLLIGSDLERGAGQQFRGATPLPPAAALGALEEPETVRRAAEVTAREARALGVGWVYAPVADVDLEPANPIVGTRALGTDPARVAELVSAWVQGCRDGGALSCAKHFPGHGRTVGDSHAELPRVDASPERLEADLLPFRAAVAAGVDSVMVAHVAYPALDPSGRPATRSAPVLQELLRRELRFRGLAATDGLVMEGFAGGADPGAAAVQAVRAGCDALLYPPDPDAMRDALRAAVQGGALPRARVEEALGRIDRAAREAEAGPGGGWGREEDRRWALATAVRSLRVVRGRPVLPPGPLRLEVVDDDLGGPHPPPSRAALPAALRRAGVELRDDGAPLLAVYSDIRGWKGRPGLSEGARRRARESLDRHPDAPVLLFGHPRLAAEIPAARHLLAAWGGEALMQEAVAERLAGRG